MARQNYRLLSRRAGAKHPVVPTDPEPQADDLTTWPQSGTFTTMSLPIADQEYGAAATSVSLIFEVTAQLPVGAKNDANSLRFTGPDGVHLGHLRTATNRIFVGGTFAVGHPITINYYWGKSGQTQPGVGFPTSVQILSDFRLFLIFENGAARDFSVTPATFTTVGAPTFVTGLNGQAMACGSGNYIQTTATKLRSGARDQRHAMALIYTPDGASSGRTICWADWSNNTRAFQLFSSENYVELYVDEDGISPYQRWTNQTPFLSGWTWIGCSWIGGSDNAIVQRDANAGISPKEFATATQATLFNSPSPYIIGGTPVAGFYHAGNVEAVIEVKTPLSTDAMVAYDLAWRQNSAFLGFDRTPNAFSFPNLSNQNLSTEVVFAKVQILGMSAGTPISVSGNGSPAYAISSSATANDDVLARTTAASTINPGQHVRVWHTTSSLNATSQIASLTIGTVKVNFQSTTKAAAGTGGGGSNIPTGPATYTVTSLAALKTVVNTQLQPGQIVELAKGDYRNQGIFEFSGKDFSGGSPAVIRCEDRPYRGQLAAEGGLMVTNEGAYQSGSGGMEFGYIKLSNMKNLAVDGLRIHYGVPSSSAGYDKWYLGDIISCSNITIQYSKICGNKLDPYASYSMLQDVYDTENQWRKLPRGLQVGIAGFCDRISFKKCFFHSIGYMQLFMAAVSNGLVEDCVFTDSNSDFIRSDGPQDNLIIRRCVFYRYFVQRSSSGSMPHCDVAQNTSIDQPGGYNHRFEMCLFGPGDGNYAHFQGPFYSANKYPTQSAPNGLYVVDSLLESRATNGIRMYPANKMRVTRTTVLQNQHGGWATGGVRDSLFNVPMIISQAGGASMGNNIIENSVYYSQDFGGSDQVNNSTQLVSSGYAANLVDYPLYGGAFRPVRFLNDNGVVVVSELARMGPKLTSSIHPNNAGGPYGASNLFAYYGALAT